MGNWPERSRARGEGEGRPGSVHGAFPSVFRTDLPARILAGSRPGAREESDGPDLLQGAEAHHALSALRLVPVMASDARLDYIGSGRATRPSTARACGRPRFAVGGMPGATATQATDTFSGRRVATTTGRGWTRHRLRAGPVCLDDQDLADLDEARSTTVKMSASESRPLRCLAASRTVFTSSGRGSIPRFSSQ